MQLNTGCEMKILKIQSKDVKQTNAGKKLSNFNILTCQIYISEDLAHHVDFLTRAHDFHMHRLRSLYSIWCSLLAVLVVFYNSLEQKPD